MALLIGMMGVMSVCGSVGYFAYSEGLRCLFIKNDLTCAKDEKCYWVMPSESENITKGTCVPRNTFTLQDGQKLRMSTGCAIVEDRGDCLAYEPEDCMWDINYKRCMHHECALLRDESACADNDACAWQQGICRKKS